MPETTAETIPDEELPATLEAKNRCPWCGENFDTIHDHSDEDECEHCGRPFGIEVVTTYVVTPFASAPCNICNGNGVTRQGYVCGYCNGTKLRMQPLRYGAPTALSCPECKGDGGIADPKYTALGFRFTVFGSKCPSCSGTGRVVPVSKVGDCAEDVDDQEGE